MAFDAVATALHGVAAGVQAVVPKQAEAARLLRVGQTNAAFPVISECLAIWQQVQVSLAAAAQAIDQPAKAVAAILLSPPDAPSGASDPLLELATSLRNLKQSVQARDWVGLADALEYDLDDLAQRWRDALLPSDGAASPAAPGAPAPLRNTRVA